MKMLYAVVLILTALVSAGSDANRLQRFEWLAKIGPSAKDGQVFNSVFQRLADSDKEEFCRRILTSISMYPAPDDVKTRRFTEMAPEMMKGQSRLCREKLIAVVYSTVPIEFLPDMTKALKFKISIDQLAMGFEEYEEFRENTLARVSKSTHGMPDAEIRDELAATLFIRVPMLTSMLFLNGYEYDFPDTGLDRVPRIFPTGYQGQGLSVVSGRKRIRNAR